MSKGSIRYIGTKQKIQQNRDSVVYGNFPKYVYAKSLIDKFNGFLGFILFMLVILALAGYYFVSDNEKTMNQISREIDSLMNSNTELQNELDRLYSYNKVDVFVKSKSNLSTAKKTIEIPAVYKSADVNVEPLEVRYKWTTGY